MKRFFAIGAAAIALTAAGAAFAQGAGEPSTRSILDKLVERGVLTAQDAQEVLDEAKAEAAEGVIRVDYVPDHVREEIKEEIRDEVVETAKSERWIDPARLPKWIDGLSFYGDMRVRSESIFFPDGNVPFADLVFINRRSDDLFDGFTFQDAIPLLNNTEDEWRLRARARFGLKAQVNDFTEVGLRFVTAADENPISTNEVLTGYFDEFIVGFDQAYVRLDLGKAFGVDADHADYHFWGGKFVNPFLSTDIMFDEDLHFDGAAITARQGFLDERVGVFVAGGAFPLNELAFSGDDQWLYAGQAGVYGKPTDRLSVKLAGAYYLFDNIQATLNDPNGRDTDDTVPAFFRKGNTYFNIRNDQPATINTLRFGLASEFEVLAVTGKVDFAISEDMSVGVIAEYLKNQALDETAFGFAGDPDNVTDDQFSTGDMAWQAALYFGHGRIDAAGDWSIRAAYKKMESDATVDAFVDSNFGLGGTNQKGFEVEGALGVGKDLWLGAKVLSARSIDIPGVANGGQFDVDTVQVDLNARF